MLHACWVCGTFFSVLLAASFKSEIYKSTVLISTWSVVVRIASNRWECCTRVGFPGDRDWTRAKFALQKKKGGRTEMKPDQTCCSTLASHFSGVDTRENKKQNKISINPLLGCLI